MKTANSPLAEFRPSLLRLLVRRIFIAIVMAGIVASISHDSWSLMVLLVFSIFFIVEALYYTPPDPSRYLIIISNWGISGPTTNRRHISLSLNEIDIPKSRAQRNWYEWLYNTRKIYASNGEKVFVYCDAYAKGAFEQMLQTIGRLQNVSDS